MCRTSFEMAMDHYKHDESYQRQAILAVDEKAFEARLSKIAKESEQQVVAGASRRQQRSL